MNKEFQTNPYDHLLNRTEEGADIKIEDVKTIRVHEDDKERIHIFLANPAPFRYYVGCEISIPGVIERCYNTVNDCAKMGFATSKQNAMLYMLGRIMANFGEKLPEHIAHEVKQAIFDNRQRSLF